MTTLLDILIGILIIFITITPFLWKEKEGKYILIITALLCIGLYIFQGFSKYEKDKEFERLRKEDQMYREKIIGQQAALSRSQQMMIEKQNRFEAMLKKSVETKVITKATAEKLKNIFYETLSSKVTLKDEVEVKLIPANK